MKEHLDYAERVRTTRRTTVVVVLFSVAFLAYVAGLWFHQVLRGEEYRLEADNNAAENAIRPLEVSMCSESSATIFPS